jgi:7-keto-8-aminopelargonate synthetase-like enzyme
MKESIRCLNLASYNYLGFAGNKVPYFNELIDCVKEYGISTQSPAIELGIFWIQELNISFSSKFIKKKISMAG